MSERVSVFRAGDPVVVVDIIDLEGDEAGGEYVDVNMGRFGVVEEIDVNHMRPVCVDVSDIEGYAFEYFLDGELAIDERVRLFQGET